MKRALSRKNLWDKAPAIAKSLIGKALSLAPLPHLLGRDFRRWYTFASAADRWDAERTRNYQLRELRRILTLAYERTEFYRASFTSVGFEPGDLKQPEDLQRLPTIDKATIRQEWKRMLTRPTTDPDVDMVTTGGTSGEPLRFYMSSSRHAREFAHLCACWRRVGYSPGDTMAVLRGRLITKKRTGMYYDYDPVLRHHYYSTFHMTPPDLRGYIRHIQESRPAYIHAYPTALVALARFAICEDIALPTGLRGALVESEPIFADQRTLLGDRLGLPIFSAYGLSEKVVLAAECEHSHEYHVAPSYGYCEIVDSNGLIVHQGGHGEVTGTGFINEVMPFIRYRTGDDARFRGRKCCSCGREHLMIDEISPRRGQEFLVARDSRTLISMASLNVHDDTFRGVLRFQFVQHEPGRAVLKVVTTNDDPRKVAERIQRHFAVALGHTVDLTLEIAADIHLTAMGKQPMILQFWPGMAELLNVRRQPTSPGCGKG